MTSRADMPDPPAQDRRAPASPAGVVVDPVLGRCTCWCCTLNLAAALHKARTRRRSRMNDVYKAGPVIPMPSYIFDECAVCGEPIKGAAIISGFVLAWHRDCFFPPTENIGDVGTDDASTEESGT